MNILEARRRTLGKGVYKKTVEGNPAIAQGSLARRYPGITMQGWTEQAQYEGKNLFDLQKLIAIIPETVDPNTAITLSVGGLKANTQYTLSAQIPGSTSGDFMNRCIYLGGNEINDCAYQDHPITKQTNNTGTITIFFYNGRNGSQTILDGVGYVQLEEGAVETTYEPYTGGAPSPSPDYPQEIVSAGKYDEASRKYEYQVKLTGANLFNPNGEIVVGSVYYGIPLNNKGIVSMALYEKNPDVDVSNIYFGICSEELNSNDVIWALASGTIQSGGKIISPMNNKYVCWYPGNDATLQKLLSRYDVMVNYGDGVYLPYQPYKEQTVLLQSDRPLTKWDKLEKRDGVWGWVYKSAEIESYTDESVPGEYYSTTGQLSVGAQVWYETATKTFVPLFPEEQKQMNALHTFRPTTVLSNDCECEMSLTYKTKKSLEVTT